MRIISEFPLRTNSFTGSVAVGARWFRHTRLECNYSQLKTQNHSNERNKSISCQPMSRRCEWNLYLKGFLQQMRTYRTSLGQFAKPPPPPLPLVILALLRACTTKTSELLSTLSWNPLYWGLEGPIPVSGVPMLVIVCCFRGLKNSCGQRGLLVTDSRDNGWWENKLFTGKRQERKQKITCLNLLAIRFVALRYVACTALLLLSRIMFWRICHARG